MSDNKQHYEYISEDPNVKIKPIMFALMIGAFIAFLNETLLNIALSSLMDEFNLSLTSVQWMATGFMLVMGIIVPSSALFIQWFTTRQMFIGMMIAFTFGTAVCAAAPTFPILLIGRLLQAIGTGLLFPVTFNTFLLIYPPHKRGAILGLLGLVFMFAPAIGPTLSGLIVGYFGWRYLFIFVLPFALFSMLVAYKYLVNVSEVTKPKIDILSLVYSTIGFGGIVYGFSSAGGNEAGFSSPTVYIPIVAGLISIILFVHRQSILKEPVLDLRVFKFPMYRLGVTMLFILVMAMFSSEIILPIYMQGPLAFSAATAGLVLLPGALLNGLLSPITGHLFDKFGPRVLMIPASFLLSGTLLLLTQLSMNTSIWMIVISYTLLMIAVAAIMMPAETNGLNQLPKKLYPHGTAVISTIQPVAGAIGVSVFISIMNARQNHYVMSATNPLDEKTIYEGMVAGVELVYWIVFLISIFSIVMAFFVYRGVSIEKMNAKLDQKI